VAAEVQVPTSVLEVEVVVPLSAAVPVVQQRQEMHLVLVVVPTAVLL
jgi:hypothetical protein